MRRTATAFAVLVSLLILTFAAQAAQITSRAGASANVAATALPAFAALIRDLESRGAVIKYMTGTRPRVERVCAPPRHKHPCGLALDICQTHRGIVDPRCHLPSRSMLNAIARVHGLRSGGEWSNGDHGHVEVPTRGDASGGRGRHHGSVVWRQPPMPFSSF